MSNAEGNSSIVDTDASQLAYGMDRTKWTISSETQPLNDYKTECTEIKNWSNRIHSIVRTSLDGYRQLDDEGMLQHFKDYATVIAQTAVPTGVITDSELVGCLRLL